jgi:hypothetical protein
MRSGVEGFFFGRSRRGQVNKSSRSAPLPQRRAEREEDCAPGACQEAGETPKRYLSLSGTRARTVALWGKQMPSDNPVFLAYAARLVEGLRKAGLPE